jgi:hypothetical protein
VAAAGLLACTTCGDDVRIERYPIGFEFLGYPDTLVGDGTDTLRIGAIVGYDRCQLEALEIAVRGDSLVVSGTARCEVHEDPRLVAAKITTPPASPNRQWIVRSLSLAPGRYFVRAGTLRDTLVVAGPTAAATRQRIVTRGMVIPSRCWYFQGEVFWECQYVLDRPPWPGTPLPYPVELHATETAPLACDTTRASLRVRSPLP